MKYSEKRNVLSLLLREERAAEWPDVLGEIVPGVGANSVRKCEAMGFAV